MEDDTERALNFHLFVLFLDVMTIDKQSCNGARSGKDDQNLLDWRGIVPEEDERGDDGHTGEDPASDHLRIHLTVFIS
jgi:hypothetical protein